MTTSSELDVDATLAGDGSLPDDASEEVVWRAGSVIDRYVITGRVGAGSMGVVYSAFDPELDRKIALKLLRPGRSRGRSARLREEAQALARVTSPHVVAVYDVGTVGDEIFIAMEFLQGQTLGAWRAREPRDWRAVLRVFIDAGRGLAAAHAAGVVHGDFKPSNVMVDDDGRAAVFDFGLARRASDSTSVSLDPERAEEPPASERSRVAGTPAYMSPEQASAKDIDAASDQFSFCIALWEALYGERPFPGRRFYEIAAALLEQSPRVPPNRRVAPKWLYRALLRGLSREPEDRWPSMDVLLQELTRDRARRRTMAALGLVVVGSLGGWGWSQYRSERSRCTREAAGAMEIWDAPRKEAVGAAIVGSGEGYAADVAERLVQGVDDYVAAWRDTYAQTCLATRRRLPDELRQTAYVCLERRRRALDSLLTAMTHEDARAALHGTEAIEALPRLSVCSDASYLAVADRRPDEPETARAVEALRDRISDARAALAVGRMEAAREIAQEVVDEADRLSYAPISALAHSELGALYQTLGDIEPAREHLRLAYRLAVSTDRARIAASAAISLAWLEGVTAGHAEVGREWAYHADAQLLRPGAAPEARARYHTALGLIEAQDQRMDDAVAQYEQALEIRRRASGPDSLGAARLEFNLAAQVRRRGDYERSRQLQEHALAIFRERLGEDHPDLARAYNNSATTLLSLGQIEQARVYLERAQAISDQSIPEGHPHLAFAFSNLTRAYVDEGELGRALDACDRALELREGALPDDHLHIAYTLGDKAEVLRRMGRYDEAEAAIDRALAIGESRGEPDHPGLADLLTSRGLLSIAQGRGTEAVETLRHALRIQDRPASDYGDGKKAITQVALGQALWSIGGDRDEALALVRKGIALLEREPAAGRGALARDLDAMRRWLAERALPAPG